MAFPSRGFCGFPRLFILAACTPARPASYPLSLEGAQVDIHRGLPSSLYPMPALDPRSTPQIEALCETARALVDQTLLPAEAEVLSSGTVPDEGMRRLREAGMYGITIPREYGGMGLHTFAQVRVHEELGRAHHGFLHGLVLSNGIGISALLLAGSDELKQRYVPAVARGELTTAFALTEPEAGSDAGKIST